MHRWFLILAVLAILVAIPGEAALEKPAPPPPPEPAPPQVPSDGSGLIAYFQHRTPSPANTEKITAAIRQLGSDNFKARQEASAQLAKFGIVALPFLRKAQEDADAEIASRASQLLMRIEKENDPAQVVAAAEALARLKPAGAAGPLLAYLPFARDDSAAEAVQSALDVLAVRDGKAEPTLLRALDDAQPTRRAAAAAALVRGGPAALRKDLHKMLRDTNPEVRLRVALAFVAVRDKVGVPVLIALLDVLPREQLWPVEESLGLLAGDKAPQLALGDGSSAKVRKAWEAWWHEHKDNVDLARLEGARRMLGYTLVVMRGMRGKISWEVAEFTHDGALRWQINDLRYPMDAQVVGKDRVLIAEYQGQEVTERNFKGEILWKKTIAMPIGCQRLANGNTFIVSRQQLLEVDRKGREVFSYRPMNFLIVGAKKLRDGHIGVVATDGNFTRLDAKGKVLKSFPVGRLYTIGMGFDMLPNGHVLIPDYRASRVVEYDADGKTVWQVATPRPISAMRLRNGNTLVAGRLAGQISEMNAKGEVVWRHKVNGYVIKASRR